MVRATLSYLLRSLGWLVQWVQAEYGLFRPHRLESTPVTVPALPAHLQAGSPTLDQHLVFIKDTFEKENDRKVVLESKGAQLLGQAGLVLSLVGILIPLLSDGLRHLPWLLGAVVGLFTATMVLFTNAVFHASSLTKVWGWNYMQPGAENIFKQYDLPANSGQEPHKSELIVDYYQSYQHNRSVNNQKANYLSFAANSFTSALLLMGLLVLLLSLGVLFKPGNSGGGRLLGNQTSTSSVFWGA